MRGVATGDEVEGDEVDGCLRALHAMSPKDPTGLCRHVIDQHRRDPLFACGGLAIAARACHANP
jgi:hypothetical protein